MPATRGKTEAALRTSTLFVGLKRILLTRHSVGNFPFSRPANLLSAEEIPFIRIYRKRILPCVETK